MGTFYKPELVGERYLSGKQVMELLHISPRTLQTYRDTWLLPYTAIGGMILYPASKIRFRIIYNAVKQ